MADSPSLRAVSYPSDEYQRRYDALVGLDSIKSDLVAALHVALRPTDFNKWAEQHPGLRKLRELVLSRPQLFIFAGDVGSGKTELAETIGDKLAREYRISVTLFSMSLTTRGSGFVGEMTQRLVSAFDEVRQWGEKRAAGTSAGILFIDEADAIAQSRELVEMHHEDRAGVNALIRGIDDISKANIRVAVILATNRLDALDPAVHRRAALICHFLRPNSEQLLTLLESYLPFPQNVLNRIAQSLLPSGSREHGMTYSDVLNRLLPRIALAAFRDGLEITPALVQRCADETPSTVPFSGVN